MYSRLKFKEKLRIKVLFIILTSQVFAARTLATHLSIVTGSRLGAVLL